ncbi:hypothetical protein [Arthrobacter glacialis]|uniref:Uncharacterized protein n=1 Tax=Arthrobacter glacialis TaxID=1664 RepID=A0A2S4A223_ARTGL|nr:hypothetical protein [Arthrobacter glacialis]POH75177.1 hypothetical protein CVS27_00765 [Arthrobacter glacialis]
MPVPSREHAPILRKLPKEIRNVSPKLSFFTWHVLDEGGPQVYIDSVHHAAGNRGGGESFDGAENRIVAKGQIRLGWSDREDGIGFAFSVADAKEITDLEGTGTLDPEFEGRPGLESY